MTNTEGNIFTPALFIYLKAQLVIICSLKFGVDPLMPTHHRILIYSYQEVHGMTSWEGTLGSIVASEICPSKPPTPKDSNNCRDLDLSGIKIFSSF